MSDIGVLVTLDEEALKNQAILDYTSRDFVSIRSQLVGLAKGIMPDWNTSGEASDFGTLILELFAYMGDTLHYYIDRTASEAFLATAVRQQSVFYIADMLGYQPIGQHAASVYLSFSMEPPAEETSVPDVTLPKGTQVTTSADNADSVVIFETAQSVTLHSGDVDIQVFAEEGITINSLFVGVSAGVPNTEFMLPNTGVVHGSISCVTTEGFTTVTWAYTSDLSLARPSQPVFTTFMDDTGVTHIVFGDNSSGRIPAIGARVYASYRYGVGALANAVAEDKLTTIVPVPGVDLSFVTVTNTESPAGGADPETISSLKFNIPRAGARIRNRAVTLNDYAHLALQVPGVSKSVAYGAVYTSVHVRIAPVDGRATVQGMLDLITAVESYLADKVLIGSAVIAEPEDLDDLFVDTYLRISVHVVETFNRTSVRSQVDAVLRKQLDFDNVDFGYRVTLGGIYRAALSVQGVEWAEVRWLSTDAPNDQPIGGTTENPPVAENLINGTWKYDSSVTLADPGTGEYRVNSATNPTWLAISKHDTRYASTGVDPSTDLLALQVGDHIMYRPSLETWAWYDLIVQEVPTNHAGTPGWVDVTVAVNQTAADPVLPTAGGQVLFQFIRYNPTPVSSGNIADIVTDELMIPRIEPTEIIEDEDSVSEVQRITPTGTISGGTWTLTFPTLTGTSVTTAAIVYNATAGQIKAAINAAIPNTVITDKKITVTGGPINTAYVTLTYAIGYGDVDAATVDDALLTGTTPNLAVTTITEGIVGNWIAAGLTEAERTHDGLWVLATGGVALT